jgi:hypothetical protein
MVARANAHSYREVPPVLNQQPEGFALTRKGWACLMGGVVAFWLAALAVFGGMLHMHLQSASQSAASAPSMEQLAESSEANLSEQSAEQAAQGESLRTERQAPPMAFVTPEPPKPSGPSPELVVEDLDKTLAQMTDETNKSLHELDAFLMALIENDQALAQFAEEMFSAESKARCVLDPQGHKEWCKDRFTQLVLDPSDLTSYLDQMYGGLNTKLLRLRAEELVRLKLDQDLEHQSFGLASTEGNPVESASKKAARLAAIHAANDVPEFIARQVIAWLASYVAEEAAKSLAGDSQEGQWLAFGFGLLVEQQVDQALYQNSNPEGKLIASLRNELIELREKLLDAESSQSAYRQLQELLNAHRGAQVKALLKWLPPELTQGAAAE